MQRRITSINVSKDKMIQNGYKRMLKSSDSAENELWNQTYRELKAEKEQLLEKLACINKADDEFYKQSDLILKFCKNASKIFLEATPSEKRTICKIIGSNSLKINPALKRAS